ncbi:MAG: hypothetical protein ACM3MA_03285 [Acidobacteriota bacterium]
MLLTNVYKVEEIDGSIQELLLDLTDLYEKRGELMSTPRQPVQPPQRSLLDKLDVDLSSVDLSLSQPACERLSL